MFSGTLKSSNSELVLKVKNNGSHHFTSSTPKIALNDITGRGFDLCSKEDVKLAPGDGKNFTLRLKIELKTLVLPRRLLRLQNGL